MFEFIKNLFRRTPAEPAAESKCPFLSHIDINESIVITEVELEEVKPKVRKPKMALKEIKPVIDNVVPLVRPTAEKPVKPKNPAKPKKVAVKETVSLVSPVADKPKPKGRPKKTPAK